MIRIGVDTGGTFTDLVRLDGSGLRVHKVRSTPDDPAKAILEGIAFLTGNAAVTEVVHGSTVATNAVLERKGARIALVATRGFEDVLRIGRQTRSRLYDFQVDAPQPLVDPELVFGVTERLDHRGEILQPLDPEEVQRLAQKLAALEVECVAVCLLHSYANPTHEQRIAEILSAAGLLVTTSHQVLPEYREYERWSTTALNAYVTPIMSRYLTTLEEGLGGTRLHIMQSNGGTLASAQARSTPARTVLSGPAAGVVGAQAIAQAAGFPRVILFDMGGTSTDVSLIDGHLAYTSESVVGDFPVRLPMLDIHTVGAGGGSIAFRDSGGSLRVGPRSAGANPGPVCYGIGDELTVSDANLLLGRLPAEHFLGGRMKLDLARTKARAQEVAAEFGITPERLAEGILEIANANMEHAIRVVSIQRGYDPREFALLAFGGAGGMHACDVAEAMEIDTVLVPRHAGVLSALGMLLADVRKDYTQTVLLPSSEMTAARAQELFAPLVERGYTELAAEGFGEDAIAIECLLEMRYQGQAYEIGVPLGANVEEEFHARHRTLYGYANPSRATEIVNLRVNASGITKKASLPTHEASPKPMPTPLSYARARFHREWMTTPVYDRDQLLPGCEASGPAIIAGNEATITIPPSFQFHVDAHQTLHATRLRVPSHAEADDPRTVGATKS